MLSYDEMAGGEDIFDTAAEEARSGKGDAESHSLGVWVTAEDIFCIELLRLPWNVASRLEADDLRRIPGLGWFSITSRAYNSSKYTLCLLEYSRRTVVGCDQI